MLKKTLLIAICLAALAIASPMAAAHKTIDLGDSEYAGTVGWLNEPPIVDEPNAVLIRLKGPADAPGAVTGEGDGHGSTGGHGDEAAVVPITGQAQNLTVVLKIGGKETTLQFRERHGAPGEYLANVIQTVPGVYNATYRFNLNGETHTIVTDLQEVQPPSSQAFPESTKSHFEMQREIDALKQEVAALKAELQTQAQTPATVTSQTPESGNNSVPGPALVLIVGAVGLLALAARRRVR